MSIVDLAKARAYADNEVEYAIAADWIHELADEVESLTRTLDAARDNERAALADAEKLRAERDAAVLGLQELYERIGAMLREARHIVEHHPEPAAAGAAMSDAGPPCFRNYELPQGRTWESFRFLIEEFENVRWGGDPTDQLVTDEPVERDRIMKEILRQGHDVCVADRTTGGVVCVENPAKEDQ